MENTTNCPCGSEASFDSCCGPLLNNDRPAATAEALMRSRYTAYTRCDIDYVERTTHPTSREDFDKEEARQWAEGTDWRGLDIIETAGGGADDDRGTVQFIAHYAEGGLLKKHHEVATFIKDNGEWRFETGEPGKLKPFMRPEQKVGRNDPCPCGSGKKHKKCCLQAAPTT